MDPYPSPPLEIDADSSPPLEIEDLCQIKLQKDNGKLINFGFLPSFTVYQVDFGIRNALNIPKTSSYSISFKHNGDDIHIAPSGAMLKTCSMLTNTPTLDIRVRPPTPQLQPQPQSCNLWIENREIVSSRAFLALVSTSSSTNKGNDVQRWPWPALLERLDHRNNRLTTQSGQPQPDWIRI